MSKVIVVYSDIWCSFAHITIARMHAARTKLGLEKEVRFDHRAFPLELLNNASSPRTGTDSEVARMAILEPDAGWQLWQNKDYYYPSTTLPALEAVQAAKLQSLEAGEQLDLALRKAFWARSKNISNRKVILDAAASTGAVDVTELTTALDDGRARKTLSEQAAIAATDQVRCSPHLFLPDGSDHANPGISSHWEGRYGVGYPVVDADDREVVTDLIKRAAG